MEGYIEKMKDQFGRRVPQGEDEEDVEPEDKPAVGFVPDLLVDSQIYQWAGIGFGQ